MALLRLGPLPDEPLAAAAAFHTDQLPAIRDALTGGDEALTLVFAPADHTHAAWRLAAVQSLARAHAPRRVNAVCGGDERGVAAAEAYLARAEGVTGQLLMLCGTGAGPVLS